MKEMEGIDASLADLASVRHKIYFVLGGLFQYPGDKEYQQLLDLAEELKKDSEVTSNFPYFNSLKKLLGGLGQLSEDEMTDLQGDYIDTFRVGRPKTPCPLNESAYLGKEGQMSGWVVSQVERSYVAGGFSLTDAAKGDLPDHLALELEYMSILCAKETDARDQDNENAASDSLRLQRMFLHQHLLRWIKLVTDKLQLVTVEESLYHQLAGVAHAFVVGDGDFVEALARSEEHTSELQSH